MCIKTYLSVTLFGCTLSKFSLVPSDLPTLTHFAGNSRIYSHSHALPLAMSILTHIRLRLCRNIFKNIYYRLNRLTISRALHLCEDGRSLIPMMVWAWSCQDGRSLIAMMVWAWSCQDGRSLIAMMVWAWSCQDGRSKWLFWQWWYGRYVNCIFESKRPFNHHLWLE